MPTPRCRLLRRLTPPAILGAGALLAGCTPAEKSQRTMLEAGDFRGPTAPAAAREQSDPAVVSVINTGAADPVAAPRRPISKVPVMAASSVGEGVVDVSSAIGAPRLAEPQPGAAGGEVVFDSLVGQINGRPVFASTFLDPLGPRLTALRKDYPDLRSWTREAKRIIEETLSDRVRNDLVLAEALAGLTPEMKEQGLRYVLGQLRGDLVRQNAGSAESADVHLKESEGLSIDQKAKEQLNKELQWSELQRHVYSTVNVSTRDEKRYYEQNYGLFNPAGVASIRLIQVRSADATGVAQATEMLDSGVPFEEVAKLPANSFKRSDGGLLAMRLDKPYEETEFFAAGELNDAAHALTAGQTAGPIQYKTDTCWLHLDGIERPPGVSMYDAQLEIRDRLREQKLIDANRRYLERLLRRGSFSDIRTMTERLLLIAVERYYGQGA